MRQWLSDLAGRHRAKVVTEYLDDLLGVGAGK